MKGVNGGLRKSLLRLHKRPLFAYPQMAVDAVLNRFCPIGYEDEAGFHYGRPGDRTEDGRRSLED
jgi:hypothetical protein